MRGTPPLPHPQGLPDCLENDFVGASHSALVELLRAQHLDPKSFLDSLVQLIEEHGATHNQRTLLTEASDSGRSNP